MQRLALPSTRRSPRHERTSYFFGRMRLLIESPLSFNQGPLAFSVHQLCCPVFGRSAGQEGSSFTRSSRARAGHLSLGVFCASQLTQHGPRGSGFPIGNSHRGLSGCSVSLELEMASTLPSPEVRSSKRTSLRGTSPNKGGSTAAFTGPETAADAEWPTAVFLT